VTTDASVAVKDSRRRARRLRCCIGRSGTAEEDCMLSKTSLLRLAVAAFVVCTQPCDDAGRALEPEAVPPPPPPPPPPPLETRLFPGCQPPPP
jgi:hypothetical protein